jgi:micrococcal nuclease
VPPMKPVWHLSILLTILQPSLTVASVFCGPIVSVLDGDTLDIQCEDNIERVRLNGIDAPEKGQVFGRQAQQFVEDMTMGQSVIIETKGQDKDKRTIGDVFLPDGRHLNKELVKMGLAWWTCQHSSDAELQQLEEDAREKNRGLWKDPTPIPPWVYRQLQGKQNPERADADCPGLSSQPILQNAGFAPNDADVIGNRRSHIYHRIDCPGYDLIAEDHRIAFVSVEAAEQAGYRVARNCP